MQPAGLNKQCRSPLEERLHDLGKYGLTVHEIPHALSEGPASYEPDLQPKGTKQSSDRLFSTGERANEELPSGDQSSRALAV